MRRSLCLRMCLMLCAVALPLEASVPPQSPAQQKSYRHPDLYLNLQLQPVSSLGSDKQGAREALAIMGVAPDAAFFESRSGRVSSFILSEPLIPGTGVGNTLRWIDADSTGPVNEALVKEATWDALIQYLDRFQSELQIDLSELGTPRIGVHEQGNLVQIYAPRRVGGIPVRDSSLSAVINHGNLILLGLEAWAPVSTALSAGVSSDEARAAVVQHAQPFAIESFGKDGHLELIAMARGEGIEYRLAWVLRASIENDLGSWEGLVDAATGRLIAFEDKNQYQTSRDVIGGVYPVSSDQRPPDGVEQVGWPMPFANVTVGAQTRTTTTGGMLGCAAGTISTALAGPFLRMNDICGAINESSATSIDLGFGPSPLDTDCVVPAGHSAGDTKASRTGFYELNRVIEQAKGYLPTNAWLQAQLVANMNIVNTCNAFWDGVAGTVNFYRDNGSQCRNTGEIAGILDHEWGHGMDGNGVNPSSSWPGEGLADIHDYLRTFVSCHGRGTLKNQVCPGYGDPCDAPVATGCTGIRDINFTGRTCNLPHTITYVTQGFTAGQCGGLARPACPTGGATGPCNREGHCEGAVVAESAWDLGRRDLTAPPFSFDLNTAHELTTRLFFLGSQNVGSWYTCQVGGGCAASGGYLQVLGVDDDDGDIVNGTPHMTAIRAAFERHETHCAVPAAVNSGCTGGPATAPTVTAAPFGNGVNLSWTAVTGAARYSVYRTEGVAACNFGKVKIAEVTGLSYSDQGLLNGRLYSYIVLPVGSNTSCFGLASACASATPITAAADLRVLDAFALDIVGGDGDEFLDNCEIGTVSFQVENSGTAPLTNVRLVAIVPLTHPATIVTTTLPAPIVPDLAACATGNGSFTFIPQGMTQGQTTELRIDVTANEIAPAVRSFVVRIGDGENDWISTASRTFNFDASLEGWTVTAGTFVRLAPGAEGTPFHVSSSSMLANQCDVIRSPLVRLRANSTLSLFDRYDIEPTDPQGGPYDRANVGVVDVLNATRTVAIPSSGQLYTLASGAPNGTCSTSNQAGWNAQSPGYPAFNASNWSSAALNPGGVFTHRQAFLEIRYGTDELLHPDGFDFDQATLTNFDLQGADQQPNTCQAQAAEPAALAVDASGNRVFQPGETVVMAPSWRNVGTQVITLTGVASNFTGPGGPTYTIVDGSAAYGTLAVGQAAACTDCYSLSVNGARPVIHWDATVLETVTPTATTKNWTLHIGDSFTDVPGSNPFYRFIETLLHRSVTGGCTANAYCPTSSTSREQMPVFVLVSKERAGYTPPPCTTPPFNDVPTSSPFCPWIQELAVRGVVGGCGGGNYCPTTAVARDTMAVFVLATLEGAGYAPPPCTTPPFNDVPTSSPFCRWIQELAVRGIVGGCGGGNYCPSQPVSREQMSVFLAGGFGLALYGI